MGIRVHFRPVDLSLSWTLHLWQNTSSWDLAGASAGEGVIYELPDNVDPRKVRFKFFSTDPTTHLVNWEKEDFVRIVRLDVAELWTYEATARVLHADPFPTGTSFAAGDTVTINLITQSRFRGGRLYIWNPFDASGPSAYIDQTDRHDDTNTSVFRFQLQPWMTTGFHFKFVRAYNDGQYWEPDSSNRVWRPVDGAIFWCKSGQVSVRKDPLTLVSTQVEVLLAAGSTPPALSLYDPVEDFQQLLTPTLVNHFCSPLFKVAAYSGDIYPDAAYTLAAPDGYENPRVIRAFPAYPEDISAVSRFALGVDGWLDAFPTVAPTTKLVVQPMSSASFPGGLSVEVALGSAASYFTVQASKRNDGRWEADLQVAPNLKTSVRLLPGGEQEYRLFEWVDTARFFIPLPTQMTVTTTEGVFGMATGRTTDFQEVAPASRESLMKAAFGNAIVSARVFPPEEMPHGATRLGEFVYFVIFAPHAVIASLVLVDEDAPGGPARKLVPMSLTPDTRYWWTKVPAAEAPPGVRYRFALNDTTEVIDPASREVIDKSRWETSPADDPADPETTWSVVLDVESVREQAHKQPWNTMGWESLIIYELHARRFTDLTVDGMPPLDVLADELKPMSRRGKPGYLRNLPVTALELLPLHEFKSSASWGYNPACYFAIDSSYGGSKSMANLVNAAHEAGRGVILDLVYNHSLDSPLMRVARDVYRNGDAYGDRMNCGHPMVLEFLRQATIHIWRTFGIDGFRVDDTKLIVTQCLGGWQFLEKIRKAVRDAAAAEGLRTPIVIAENDPKVWDMANPGWSIVDGEWALDEVYRIRDTSYLTWKESDDNAMELKREMDSPSWWGRPFYIATRYGESHDMVSGQDKANARIATRPPFRQGLQMAKALGTVSLLSNGIPMLFMGQEYGETRYFSFGNDGPITNPQVHDLPLSEATDNTRVLEWFRSLMGLRRDDSKGLKGNDNYQVVSTGRRTIAFTCGRDARLFAVVTFGTPDQRQDSSWLGLPDGRQYKEIFNSSWPAFQVEFEQERTNGSYDAWISKGSILNLPWIGAVVLEQR